MIQILLNNHLEDYGFNLKNNNGLVSFTDGTPLNLPKEVKYIIPGYIERHIHGGYGIDFMDGNLKDNKLLLSKLTESGVTCVYPTSMSKDYFAIKQMIDNIPVDDYRGAKCAKIHLEGPFINIQKCGAQNPDFIKHPDLDFLETIKDKVAVVSYAPELDYDFTFLKYLDRHKIIPSVVHSNASASEIKLAYGNGLKNFSHFYNGSSGFDHRKPGVVNAGLTLDYVFLELICDGEHVNCDVIEQTYKIKGIDAIVLITDSMRARGMDDGVYDLGGQLVTLKDSVVRLENGSLAGSILSMDAAVKNFYKFTNCPLEEAFLAATRNVAKSLNRFDIGVINEGSCFDIVFLDEQLNVIRTYVDGVLVYDREN